MTWLQWVAVILLILTLLLLAYLLWNLLRRLKRQLEESEEDIWGEGDSGYGDEDDDESDYARYGEERRENQARQILASGNKDVIELMRHEAGIGDGELTDRAQEAELVRRLASRLGNLDIEVLRRAATQDEVQFDLETTTERRPVDYPTHDIEPDQMEGLEQLQETSYEDMIGDDFFEKAALGDLTVMQAYESETKQKLMYILMDVSLSMENPMADGRPRHIWSRAVGVSLMLEAVRGNAKYFLRFFDSRPHPLITATSKEEALTVAKTIQRSGLSPAGTDISYAIEQAIEDIRGKGGEIAQSEILLISDGEDENLNLSALRAGLGSDIRLHVVLIGSHSDLLKAAASSYKEFN